MSADQIPGGGMTSGGNPYYCVTSAFVDNSVS